MDDQEKQKELERKKVLEQIRKRAEEAELKRIEEEEQKITSAPPTATRPEPPTPPPSPSSIQQSKQAASPRRPEPPPPPPEPEPLSPLEEKIQELREKFSIAIDRGKLDKADELFEELNTLVDDVDVLRELRESLEKLRKLQEEESKAKKRAEAQKSKQSSRAQKEAEQKKVAALLEKANNFYQREKYDKAQESIDELLEIDEEHDEAKELSANIAKARELAEKVREEESKRKASEAALATPVVPQPPPMAQSPGDVWGSKETEKPEDELGMPEVADEPKGPPKPPLVERLVERASTVRIPLKPILITIAAVLIAWSAYFIYTSLKEAVFPPKYSLLVLPALGTSADSSTQYIAEAVTEDLINTIGVVNELRVIAAATSFSLSNYAGDYRQMARNLGASFFLQWTVAKVEGRIAFQLTLSDTLSSRPIWTTQRQNSIRELQSATREIAQSILREMKIDVNPVEQEALSAVSSTSGPAYEAYAAGRWFLRQGGPLSLNNARKAFSVAVQYDSLFPEAHLGLAWAHLLAVERDDDSMAYNVSSAWRQLNLALAVRTRSSESYRVRGLIAQYQSQYDRAVEELERGAEFNPSDAETQRRLSVAYLIRGRSDEAVKASARAVADDPRNVESYKLHGLVHLFRGEDTEGLESLEQGIRYATDKSKYMSEEYADALKYTQQSDKAANILEDRAARTQKYGDYYKLGRLFQTSGRPKPQWEGKLRAARSLIQSAIAADPEDAAAYSFLALTDTRLGAFKSAIEANTRARQIAPDNLDVLYNTARMFALQTDKAQALDVLRKAVDRRYRLTSILDMDFYNLRSDPEFQQAVTR